MQQKYGDLKKQLFLFDNGYIGFDALFIDYYTNYRYNVDQEINADILALSIMKQIGISFNQIQYKNTLKIIQDENLVKQKLKTG